jgi:hypothetical protein
MEENMGLIEKRRRTFRAPWKMKGNQRQGGEVCA